MNTYKINDTFYEQPIELIVNYEAIDLENYLLKEHGFRVNQEQTDACMLNVCDKRYIYVRKFDWSIKTQGLLHHEVFHCTCDVLNALGMKCSPDSEEAYAYYYQMLIMECLDRLKHINK